MKPDKTTTFSDDKSILDLERESFAWWIIAQIGKAKEADGSFSNRQHVLSHALLRIESACLAIVADAIIDAVETADITSGVKSNQEEW